MTPEREQSLRTIRDRFLLLVPHMILLHERVAKEVGLTAVELQALHLLTLADEPLSPSELGNRSELPRSTVTRVLTSLESAGYVVREDVPSDGRRSLIRVVPATTADVSVRFDAYARAMDEATRTLDDTELAAVARYWELFDSALSRPADPSELGTAQVIRRR